MLQKIPKTVLMGVSSMKALGRMIHLRRVGRREKLALQMKQERIKESREWLSSRLTTMNQRRQNLRLLRKKWSQTLLRE